MLATTLAQIQLYDKVTFDHPTMGTIEQFETLRTQWEHEFGHLATEAMLKIRSFCRNLVLATSSSYGVPLEKIVIDWTDPCLLATEKQAAQLLYNYHLGADDLPF